MQGANKTEGFSKMSRKEKLERIAALTSDPGESISIFNSHLHPDPVTQDRYNQFSENTLSNYFLPYGIAPNFMINNQVYHIPMVTEESSVVAAAAHSAKFWLENGGFHARVLGQEKKGQVYFSWTGEPAIIREIFDKAKDELLGSVSDLTRAMEARGGGITHISLEDLCHLLPDQYVLDLSFATADAMGANFINSVLEQIADSWSKDVRSRCQELQLTGEIDILMSILSNYTPESLVKVELETAIKNMAGLDPNGDGRAFAQRFVNAVKLAELDTRRAVTHNKGIFNGIDAVVLATGNDFRAVEACGHAFASRSGKYRSLSTASLEKDIFRMSMTIPLAIGTVGGLTRLHPLAQKSLEILGNPGSEQLMMLIAAAGLANNFAAVRSLVTTGIQKGHMKMHLANIFMELGTDAEEQEKIARHFSGKTLSHGEVSSYLRQIRENKKTS